MSDRLISIIIPTRNEARWIGPCLRALRRQDYPGEYEIIVADYRSTDGTVQIAQRYADRVLHVHREGVAVGRNAGARASRGDVLIFVDADTHVPASLLSDVVRAMGKGVVGGVCAFRPAEDALLYQILYQMASWLSALSVRLGLPFIYAPGFCHFYRRDVFVRLGGFREELVYLEDNDMARRARTCGRFVFLNRPVHTSVRRYRRLGFAKTCLGYILPTLWYLTTGRVPREKSSSAPSGD